MSATDTAPRAPVSTPAPSGRRDRYRRGPMRWLVLALLIAGAAVVLFPFAIILLNAFKSPTEYSNAGPLAFPTEIYVEGMIDFWNQVNFGRKLWNSFMIAGSVAVLGVVVSLFNAYALGIGRVKGRLSIVVLFLIANMLPHEALVYPLYWMANQVGLYNTQLAVIIIFTVIQSAFGTYLLASVFGTFPQELLEAAKLDGASKWQILWRVVFPISRPTLSVLFVFFFIWTWNEFFIPLIFLISNDRQTVPVALGVLEGERLMDATTTSAAALLGVIPAVIFFLIFQRTLARGITAGAVK
ncbi:carbohydrate ABC transporter permease [Actinobacteria bacterium YIM 96077]|uniref:Carbohydrate ABC transporter permease n=1 Tax=Phytoactinopolyspora halophila TaxID=1981511 RepID=A0A329QES9_9ACTN|nr:carbohydrate ABC transporter permease [Phytoactinopolyspora halophila]AYY13432.1 carbohydrate ABC transporter permease [Actinobacteria bacterium YIM 96077]RAW10826.1 carbohydrate ABC transporter permease [Phytoactinopolyspora halophila]